MIPNLGKRQLILASQSPRRRQLLHEVGLPFTVRFKNLPEKYPESLRSFEIALFLAELKASWLKDEITTDEIVVAADTIVWFKGAVMSKPASSEEALSMLRRLSGNTHEVFTGMCIMSLKKKASFVVRTQVEFNKMSDFTLRDYVQICRPMDKAGSYGAQECLAPDLDPCSRVEKKFMRENKLQNLFLNTRVPLPEDHSFDFIKQIDGSYFNVMGLPIVEFLEELGKF